MTDQKWEYLTYVAYGDALAESLTEDGNDGWELISANLTGHLYRVIFKRPVSTIPQGTIR